MAEKARGILLGIAVLAATLVATLGSSGCTPKATVQRSTPVANLRIYHGVMVRGSSAPGLENLANDLTQRTARYVEQQCEFQAVFTGVTNTKPTKDIDLVVDLSVLKSSRGGGGIVQNPNVAVVDVKMALSDVTSDELIGSASIQGQSPAVVTNQARPEEVAIDVVAKQVTTMLMSSGCKGKRLGRVGPAEPKATPKAVTTEVTPEQVAQAEALSEEGKAAFREGDPAAAKTKFEEAIAINPDPRYIMNQCLAEEALEQYDAASATCQRVIDAKPEQRLADKAGERIKLIEQLKTGN